MDYGDENDHFKNQAKFQARIVGLVTTNINILSSLEKGTLTAMEAHSSFEVSNLHIFFLRFDPFKAMSFEVMPHHYSQRLIFVFLFYASMLKFTKVADDGILTTVFMTFTHGGGLP